MASLAFEASTLAEAGNHAAAITKLTTALDSSRSPIWLLARAKSYTAINEHQLALDDADEAWHAALSRGQRKLIMDAQYRRAVCFIRLGRYADAERACVWTTSLAEGGPVKGEDATLKDVGEGKRYLINLEAVQKHIADKQVAKKEADASAGIEHAMKSETPEEKIVNMVSVIRGHAIMLMKGLVGKGDLDGEAMRAAATMVPELGGSKTVETKTSAENVAAPALTTTEKNVVPTTTTDGNVTTSTSTAAPSPKIRTQDFQTATHMTITLMSKANDAASVSVDFTPSTVAISSLKYPDGIARPWQVTLWGYIDPAESSYAVTPNKVELKLRKKELGTWHKLYKDGSGPEAG